MTTQVLSPLFLFAAFVATFPHDARAEATEGNARSTAPAPDMAESSDGPLAPIVANPVPHKIARQPGYVGAWYSPVAIPRARRLRLSGGVAFYPVSHAPVARYAAAVNRTFFCYFGGAVKGASIADEPGRMMISYFDHATGTVPRPVILLDDLPARAHGVPAMTFDEQGRIWLFIAPIDADTGGLVFRSIEPYDITAWEKMLEMNFRDPQPWYVAGRGFMLVHASGDENDGNIYFRTSPDGLAWSNPRLLASFGHGHTFISGCDGNKVGVALTYAPSELTPFDQLNVYYLETADLGRSWRIFPRAEINVPLTDSDNPALVCDFDRHWRFLFRDLDFDARGNPVILYVTRYRKQMMPKPNSRIWYTTRWAAREWETTGTVRTDSDYDGGCLGVDKQMWYMVVPNFPGPTAGAPGGGLVRWQSDDQGRSWFPQQITFESPFNHNWPRCPANAHQQLELIWTDGDIMAPSVSRIYIADRPGNVYVLPVTMNDDTQQPALVWPAPDPDTLPWADRPSLKFAAATATAPAATTAPATAAAPTTTRPATGALPE